MSIPARLLHGVPPLIALLLASVVALSLPLPLGVLISLGASWAAHEWLHRPLAPQQRPRTSRSDLIVEQRARAQAAAIAAQSRLPVPDIVIRPDRELRAFGGAAIVLEPAPPFIVLASSLARGARARLDAVLAHELGHLADASWARRRRRSAARVSLLVGSGLFVLLALRSATILVMPPLLLVEVCARVFTVLFDQDSERRADAFAVSLDQDHGRELLAHLVAQGWRRLSWLDPGFVLHASRRRQLRALADLGHASAIELGAS